MAGVLTVTIQPDVTGPLADGEAERAVEDWARHVTAELAHQGEDLLRVFPMDKTGRARGGFQANIHALIQGPSARIPGPMIEGITWSPWLEGTSSRNLTTRFKGYHLFRKTAQELRKRAPDVGERELEKIMPRLGGA